MTQIDLTFAADITANHHGGNAESAAAHGGVDRIALRERVLKYIEARGLDGATADEVCEAFGMFHNSVAPRISELKCLGHIYAATAKRHTRLGKMAQVFCAMGDVSAL